MKFKLPFSLLGKRKDVSGPRLLTRFLRDESGSYILFMSLALPVLVAFSALGTEAGYWLYYHRVVQSAADNAAYSAATALATNSSASSSDLSLQAKAIAANDYGLVDGANGVTVTTNPVPVGTCYPSSQYIGAHPGVIEVVVEKSLSPIFLAIWLSSNVNICGRAVAKVSGGGNCVLATGTTGTVISTTRNNLSIDLNGCGLFSDSTASNSVSISGNNDAITADFLGTVGGASVSGNANTKASFTTGDPPQADPYATDAASLWHSTQQTAPTSPTVTKTATASGTGTATPSTGCVRAHGQVTGQPTITLTPGNWSNSALNALNLSNCTTSITMGAGNYVFSGSVNFPSGATVSMGAGTYVFSAGLTSGSNVTVGAGSTIIVQGSGFNNAGQVSLSGNNSIYIQAGGWTNSGTTTFVSGNNNIQIDAGGWTNSGTFTFGGGNYFMATTGDWQNTGTTNFGSGTYSITITGNWTDKVASQVGTTTFPGGGNYTFALTGDWTLNNNLSMAGTFSMSMANWDIKATSTTIGNGIYYLSGNFSIDGSGNQTITASSATLVLTGNTTTTSVISYTANNSTFTLMAPTSGWSAGIAVWEPNTGLNVTPAPSNQLASGNNSIVNIQGVFYAPNADVQLLGNTGTSPTCTQIIAKSIEFGGNSINLQGDCGGVQGVKTFGQIIALVE